MGRRDDIKGITGGKGNMIGSGVWPVQTSPFHLSWGFLFTCKGMKIWTKLRGNILRNRKLPGSKHGTQNKKDTERYPRCARWSNGWPHWRTMSHTWEGATSWRSTIWGLSGVQRSVSPGASVCLVFVCLLLPFWSFPGLFAYFHAGKVFDRLRVAMTDNAQSLIGTGVK